MVKVQGCCSGYTNGQLSYFAMLSELTGYSNYPLYSSPSAVFLEDCQDSYFSDDPGRFAIRGSVALFHIFWMPRYKPELHFSNLWVVATIV